MDGDSRCDQAHSCVCLTVTQGDPEGARAAGKSFNVPDGKEVGQSEEEIQGSPDRKPSGCCHSTSCFLSVLLLGCRKSSLQEF